MKKAIALILSLVLLLSCCSALAEDAKPLAGKKLTMVLVTHEMGFAREVSDRICFLDEGKLIEDAPPEVFFSSPKSERAKAFLEKVL